MLVFVSQDLLKVIHKPQNGVSSITGLKVPSIPKAQGGNRLVTQDLCHPWWGDPNGFSVECRPPGIEGAFYQWKL
jgi:hypothetical protein